MLNFKEKLGYVENNSMGETNTRKSAMVALKNFVKTFYFKKCLKIYKQNLKIKK